MTTPAEPNRPAGAQPWYDAPTAPPGAAGPNGPTPPATPTSPTTPATPPAGPNPYAQQGSSPAFPHGSPTLPQGSPAQPPGATGSPHTAETAPGTFGPGPGGFGPSPGGFGPGAGGFGPGGPGPGGPGGGQGGRGPSRGRLVTLLAGAVAVLVLLGAGGYALTTDDDPKKDKPAAGGTAPTPKTPKGGTAIPVEPEVEVPKGPDLNADSGPGDATAWAAWNPPRTLPGESTLLNDIWVVGDTYVQAAHKEVVAYRKSDGSRAWTVRLPAPVCDTPVNPTADGKVVIAYTNGRERPGTRCNQLRMIDLKTGEAGWRKALSGSDDTIITHLAISGDTLAVNTGPDTTGYRVADGKELFTVGNDDTIEESGVCTPRDVAGGARLLQVDWCAASGGTFRGGMRALDAGTGKVQWRYRSEGDWRISKVLSVEPLVLVETESENVIKWRVVTLDDKGKRRSELDLARVAKHDFQACAGSGDAGEGVQNCPGAAVSADTVALSQDNKLAVFDLGTGKMRWGSQWNDGLYMRPLRITDGKVTVYQAATTTKHGQIVEFGRKGGTKPREVLRHPAAAAATEYETLAGRLLYDGERLVVGASTLSGKDKGLKARLVSFAAP